MFRLMMILGYKYNALRTVLSRLLRVIYSFQFSYNETGNNVEFCYKGLGCVIHPRAVFGSNVIVAQNTTIGGRSKKNKLPKIGDNVYIGAGTMILGDVNVGNNVVIGAGSLVINDVPDNCVVVGSPAKVIKTGITSYKDYY